jgi:hypothetical protein
MLGLGLFLLYAIVSPENTTDTDRRIAVTASDLDWLRSTFASQWNRQPTASEMEGLVEGFIREEVYYREALALSLEEDDTIIRRRLVQKMEFLSEDIALAAEPSEEELQTFFEEHSEDYAIPPRLTFTQIYFSPDERGASTEDDARGVLGELKAMTPPPERAPDRGDRFMLEPDYPGLTPAETDRMFGQGFGEALKALDKESGTVLSNPGTGFIWCVSMNGLPVICRLSKKFAIWFAGTSTRIADCG